MAAVADPVRPRGGAGSRSTAKGKALRVGAGWRKLGVALGVLAAAVVGTSSASARGVHVIGPRVISRSTPLPESCNGLRQDTDTMIAGDPNNRKHLVATWDVDDHKSDVTAVSRDGGKTWKTVTVRGSRSARAACQIRS